MIVSKKLTPERIAEIKAFKNTDFSDCPFLTGEQLAKMKPRNPESFLRQRELNRQIAGPYTITLDDDTVDCLLAQASTSNKPASQIVGELIRGKPVQTV